MHRDMLQEIRAIQGAGSFSWKTYTLFSLAVVKKASLSKKSFKFCMI